MEPTLTDKSAIDFGANSSRCSQVLAPTEVFYDEHSDTFLLYASPGKASQVSDLAPASALAVLYENLEILIDLLKEAKGDTSTAPDIDAIHELFERVSLTGQKGCEVADTLAVEPLLEWSHALIPGNSNQGVVVGDLAFDEDEQTGGVRVSDIANGQVVTILRDWKLAEFAIFQLYAKLKYR